MKRIVGAAIILIAGIALYFFFRPPLTVPMERPGFESSAIVPTNAPMLVSADSHLVLSSNAEVNTQSAAEPVNLAARAGQFIAPDASYVSNLPPVTVLENMRTAMRQYGGMFGGNPVGNNLEITAQLGGKNPRHINFIDPQAGLRSDASGQLVDPWGTPYFFHQLSGTQMEIHSAGPDKTMWTSHDLVVK